tara:strand:- start:869 stop:1141 length:273 start_codon:yes stop_codon:yes gene_type:complete
MNTHITLMNLPLGVNIQNPKSVFDFIALQLKIEIPKSQYIGFETGQVLDSDNRDISLWEVNTEQSPLFLRIESDSNSGQITKLEVTGNLI